MGASVRLVGRSRVVVAVGVAAVLVCGGAASGVFAATRSTGPTTQELTITVSDGTKLACGLVLPGGSPPAGGWPGLLLFHGLGQTHAYMETIANAAFALSLGGGAVWNAAVAGVPFKAIVPAITWTSLGSALHPNGVPKTGEIVQ